MYVHMPKMLYLSICIQVLLLLWSRKGSAGLCPEKETACTVSNNG